MPKSFHTQVVSLPWSLQLSLLLTVFESASPPRAALTGQSAPAASAALLPQALSKGTSLAAAGQKSEPVVEFWDCALIHVACKKEKRLHLLHNFTVDLKKKIFFLLNLVSAHFHLHTCNTTDNVF